MNKDPQPNSLSIPKTNNDITKDWVRQATGLQPVENSITINDNIQDGVGFLSNLSRVSFQTESGSKESILVKLLPDNPEFRAMTIDQECDKREIQFYSFAFPQIAEVAPELKNNFCKFYSGKQTGEGVEYASMLVIEDLKPMGYQMLNPESEKWKENLGKIIKFIAELNAAGLALKTAKPGEFSKIVSFCMGANEKEKTGKMYELGLAKSLKVDELLLKHNYPESMGSAYRELSKYVKEILSKAFTKCEEFPCLIHGDIWSPNVMVIEGSPSHESHIKVIDWQLLGYRDASCELATAILSCLPIAQMNKVNVDIFLKMYWQEFIQACKAKGHDYKERNEEEFTHFFNTWGMSFGYYWWALSIDILPNVRVCKALEVIYEEYKIPQFLLNDHLNSS